MTEFWVWYPDWFLDAMAAYSLTCSWQTGSEASLVLPYFCLCTAWSIESSSQCKYHCTARIDQALSSV